MVRQLRWWIPAMVIMLMAGQFTSLQALDSRYKDADGDLIVDLRQGPPRGHLTRPVCISPPG